MMRNSWPAYCLAAALCLPAAPRLQAQTVEDGLRGIAPAGASCRRDDEVVIPPGPVAMLPAPDLACGIDVDRLTALLGNADTLLFDTRLAAQFTEYHIDAAVNLPWARARTSDLFKARQIVLLGDGKSERELYVACADLRNNGAPRVKVLRGGMLSWVAAGRPVIGRAPVNGGIALLTDEEFLEEAGFAGNALVAFPKATALREGLPQMSALPAATAAALSRWIAQRTRGDASPVAALVLATGAAVDSPRLRQLADAVRPRALLVYPGTAAEYAIFMRQKRAMWAAQARGPAQLPCGAR